MRLWYRVALAVLFVVPIISIYYKSRVLELPLIPRELNDEWSLQVSVDRAVFGEKSSFSLSIPESSPKQTVTNIIHDGMNSSGFQVLSSEVGSVLKWEANHPTPFNGASFGYQLRVKPHQQEPVMPRRILSDKISKSLQKYLSIENVKEQDMLALEKLEQAIINPDSSRLAAIKKAFFYVSEEIRQLPNVKNISEAIEIGSGSAYTKVRIFNYLMRRLQVPSRIGFGIQLEPDVRLRPQKNQYQPIFFNEINIDGVWYPIDLARRVMGALPEYFVVFHHDISELEGSVAGLQAMSVYSVPLRTNRFNTSAYSDDLKRTDSLYYTLSLYRLPISAQASMYIVLLLPLGAVVISLFRNIVGFGTFGIFTPVLLSLFFMETKFLFAFSFFALVVFLGFFQRMALDKLYLLAVPRISILLTLVIIAYLLFIMLNQESNDIGSSGAMLSYFPVVIITVLIERFSIDFIEDGPWNTFKKLLGTVVISLICYFVFTFNILKQLMFTNPELLLWIVAVNLIIGNYKGYRLSEFLRFKDLSRLVKV